MTGRHPYSVAKSTFPVLAAMHPTIFNLENPVPFKIGFHAEFRAAYPEMKSWLACVILQWLTSRRAYLAACTEGAPRYGLDGLPDGSVSAKHAAHAAALLKERDDRGSIAA